MLKPCLCLRVYILLKFSNVRYLHLLTVYKPLLFNVAFYYYWLCFVMS